jgi:hypothetical protein
MYFLLRCCKSSNVNPRVWLTDVFSKIPTHNSNYAFDFLKPQPIEQTTFDVFVSHASEDKDEFVRDFVKCLQENGLNVWYDEFTLRVGDSLRLFFSYDKCIV